MSSPRHETPHDLFEAARQCAACGHVYDSRQAHVCPAPRLEVDVELASLRARLLGAEQQRDELKKAVDVRDHIIGEHAMAAACFQPGGELHTRANLTLGMSAVVEGIKWLREQLVAAEQARETLRRERDALEAELRHEWWCNHGCALSARYGDDGERQCGTCLTDFKRMPFADLQARVEANRHRAVAKALQQLNGESV